MSYKGGGSGLHVCDGLGNLGKSITVNSITVLQSYMIIVADAADNVCGAKNSCGAKLLYMLSNFAPHNKLPVIWSNYHVNQ